MGDLNSDTQFSFLENNTLIVRSKHEIHVHEIVHKKLLYSITTRQSLLHTHNSSFLLLDNSGLFAVFSSKSKLVEEILLFSTIESAERLSSLNSNTSSSSEIPLLALRLGLRFQEVNLIKKSLKRLRGELQHDGRKEIMRYLCRHWYKSEEIGRAHV